MTNITPRLFVIGCSFSDLCRVDRCYGDYLAELLDLEYKHLARGVTSNDRMWRVLTKHILDGTITSDDIVVLQYTEFSRREFASYGHNYEDYFNPESSTYDGPNEKFTGSLRKDDVYFVSHFKADSYTWQANDCDKEIHNAYQKNCAVYEFDVDYFHTRHRQFEALCELHNIKLVIFWTDYPPLSVTDIDTVIGEYGRENLLLERTYLADLTQAERDGLVLGYNGGDPEIWDSSHLNDSGHRLTAKHIAEHIRNKGLI